MWASAVCPVCCEGGGAEGVCSGSGVHKQHALCLGGVLAARIFAERALWWWEPFPGVVIHFENSAGRDSVWQGLCSSAKVLLLGGIGVGMRQGRREL